jgi:hypothetical protein
MSGLKPGRGGMRMGVSRQLMPWRLNMSGAQRRVARSRAR